MSRAASGNPDPEFADVYAALSRPATGAAHVSRRRLLQGMLVAGGAGAVGLGPLGRMAGALAPVGEREGILVVVMLGGGNDGLNTVVPIGDSRYRTLRPTVAVAADQVLRLTAGTGLHPRLPLLKARYDVGKVAVIQGVGQPGRDHSHFSSMAAWMAGTAGNDRTTGWLGRYVDTLPDGDDGLRSVTVGTAIPLHLVGQRAQVTALPTDGGPFGANRAEAFEARLFDAVAGYGAGTTGKGRWGDLVADTATAAISRAGVVKPLYPDGAVALPGDLAPQLDLAARLINLNLGVRVISVTLGGFDTHDEQGNVHAELLGDLDAGIDGFFRTLQATWADQVTLMTFSEFGRRAEQNDSRGTDHGTAGVMFVVGDRVKGGLYGQPPALDRLDDRGDLTVPVDFRSVYASVLQGWMGLPAGGVATLLGATYPDLGLFRTTPGLPPPPPPPPPDRRWLPFTTVSRLVQQQYLDFLGRTADSGGTTYWSQKLTSGGTSIPACIEAFLDSNEFGRAVGPAARIALAGTGQPPLYSDLLVWTQWSRAGELARIAAAVAVSPGFLLRYQSLADAAFVARIHLDVVGIAAPAGWSDPWVRDLGAGTRTRGDVLLAVATTPEWVRRAKPSVDVLMVYAGMLRRSPDPGGYDYWVGRIVAGGSVRTLIGGFFASAEYGRRFA